MRKRLIVLLLPALLLGTTFSPLSVDSPPSRDQARTRTEVGLIQQLFFLDKMKPEVKRVGLIWKKGIANQEKKLRAAKRAAASIGGTLFVAYVQDKSGVAEKFRLLTDKHSVQALWIIENDGIVNASAPKQYLIKNTIKKGIPLLAPTSDWVNAGAPLAIGKSNGKVQIMLNEPAAQATGLKVPSKYKSQTKPLVAAN